MSLSYKILLLAMLAEIEMKLLLWSWNVNGLRAILNKDFCQVFRRENPDILGLQETKLQEHQIPDELSICGDYTVIWSHAERKGYSGTALLSRIRPISVRYGFGVAEFDNEGRIIVADYDKFILYNIYFPNGQMSDERLDYKLRFYDQCLIDMEQSRRSGKMIIVTGDYNTAHKPIDLANPKENEKSSGFLPIERAWIDKIVEYGWVDTFRQFDQSSDEYSWWSYRTGARPRNIGWRIDYFFVDREHLAQVTAAGIRQDIMGSDHCPVYIEIDIAI